MPLNMICVSIKNVTHSLPLGVCKLPLLHVPAHHVCGLLQRRACTFSGESVNVPFQKLSLDEARPAYHQHTSMGHGNVVLLGVGCHLVL